MATGSASWVVERVEGGGYEPDIIEGTQVGETRDLNPAAAEPGALDVGFWRSDPAVYDYPFTADEAFCVLEGAAMVELPETGERIELRVGDVAHFRAGIRSRWTITKPFKKFVVIAN